MSRIGIIGAGTMGEGEAHCLLEYGFDVVLHDIIPADDSKGSLKITTDLNAVFDISIVIENIIEDVNAKKSLYK